MTTREKIVAQARAWIGRKESDGSHNHIISIYNGHQPLARNYKVKSTDPWCATFISALAIKLGATDIIPTECSCSKMIELMKGKGIWQENDAHIPSPGDIIMYDWHDNGNGDCTGAPDHVGIVEKVEDGIITVIEGNINDAVGRRQLQVNGKLIRGYGLPKYAEESHATKTLDEIAREVIDGKWGNGAERKQRLTAAGHDAGAVQARVNEILSGKKTVEQIAREVIEGLWGNGSERKRRLRSAGYDPAEVQAKVNELLKK